MRAGPGAAKVPTLRRNFSWVFVGNATYAASQWAMIAVLSRLGTPEIVGQFALGLALSAPILLFTNLQLQAIQATDAKRTYQFGEYLALRILTTSVAMVAILAIAALYFQGSRTQALVILLFGVARAFESMSDGFYGLYLQRERMERLAGSLIVKGVLSFAALGTCFALTGSVVAGVAAVAAAWAAVFVFYDLPSGTGILDQGSRRLRPLWRGGRLRRLAWLALPLGVVMTLISLNTNVPNYFVEFYLGEAALGIFATAAYVMVAGTTVTGALGQSASPRLAVRYSEGDASGYVSLLLKAVGVGAALGAMGILAALVAGEWILVLLYGPQYAEGAEFFVLLMVAAAFGYMGSFTGFGLTAARYFRIQMPLLALTTASAALACWALVPAYGLPGAAIALIIGSVVQLCGSSLAVIHAVRKLDGGSSVAN